MDIPPKINRKATPGMKSAISQNVAEAASIVFNLKQKKVKVRPSKIKQITKGLAEIAFSLGETNDPEEYSEELAEDIYESMKEAKQKIQKTKKGKKN